MAKHITFLPYDLTVEVEEGANLLKAALAAGVHINASCGGAGVCGKCRVILEAGALDCPETTLLTREEWQQGYRQACQCLVQSDVVVRIPRNPCWTNAPSPAAGPGYLYGPRPLTSPPSRPRAFMTPPSRKISAAAASQPGGQPLRPLPAGRGLARQHGLNNLTLDFLLVRKLARVMRQENFAVTATLDFAQRRSRNPRLVNLEAGDTTQRHYALAVDIGTTTVWVQLLDLAQGEIIGQAADYNGQMAYGDDVISRILYSQKEGDSPPCKRRW